MVTNNNVKWAEGEIAKREAEIADLRVYIRVEQTKGEGGALAPNIPPQPPIDWPEVLADPTVRGAKKRAILGAMARSPGSLTTSMIVEACILAGLKDTAVANTSPQLSLYKSEGLVDLASDGWTITRKGRDYLAHKN